MVHGTGIPPTGGFFGKVYLFGGAFSVPEQNPFHLPMYVLAVIGVINAVIGAAYYLRIGRLCLDLDRREQALICALLLRGPQTPGELRARSGRLHAFADNAAVVTALNGLIEREPDPLVVKLPRTPGRKDSEYMHLFGGPIDMDAHVAAAAASRSVRAPQRGGIAELTERVDRLEAELAELKEQLGVRSGD